MTISRPDLYAALRSEATQRGIHTEHGKRLVDVETTDGAVRARFADGGTAEGDLLVGADGTHSATRLLIDPAAPQATYVGFLNTGGYARDVDVPGEPGVNYLVFGKRSFFGYIKAPNGEVWWFANPPSAGDPDPAALAAIPPQQWKAQLLDLFAKDSTPALDAIEHTEHIFAGWATYDMPSVPRWRTDRMVIIGDAAHAVSPSAGQGASMAIEDAVTLARCLRDIPDVSQAFARYEELRRDRVERIVAQRAQRGEQVLVNVRNELGEVTTVHWHGMHLPAAMDGGPHQPIAPGDTWSPTWRIDQPAATLWYHPHPHGETEGHVYRGLAGMFILDDADPAVELPDEYGVDDIPVIVQDKRFHDDGRLDDASPIGSAIGVLGDTIAVNGTVAPYLDVTTERVRLRLLNGSTARTYDFGFDDDRAFALVGTDGGLLAASTRTTPPGCGCPPASAPRSW